MVRTKVFVGNLSFNTKENELSKEFEAAGKVISANIITRGPRSLGYGFVEMDNETDAQNAVKMLDKKEIDGRAINVEVARVREEGADSAQSAIAQGVARTRGGRGRGRGGRGGNTNAPRQNQGQQQPRQQNQSQQNQGNGQRRRTDEEGSDQQNQPKKVRAPRPPRATRPEGEDTRTPSTTTLFVANLPFSVLDENFSKVLKDAGLSFKTAHVVKKRTGRSKGFGFIEFDNEGDQQKALAALNNKDVEGRPISVKVALGEFRTGDDSTKTVNAPVKTSSPAPTKNTASPSPVKSSPAPTKSSSPAPTKKEDTPKQEKK